MYTLDKMGHEETPSTSNNLKLTTQLNIYKVVSFSFL